MFKHTLRLRQMEVCLCCCLPAVTLLSHHCVSLVSRPSLGCCVYFAGETWI